MYSPFYVEEHRARTTGDGRRIITEYALMEVGEGPKVVGTDLPFLHHLADVLNEERLGSDIHR